MDDATFIRKHPSLEIIITHSSAFHIQTASDSVIAVYKPPVSTPQKLFQEDQEETYEIVVIDEETDISRLQKSVVIEYRKKTDYFGPLKVSVDRLKILDDGQEKEILKTKLMHVRLSSKILYSEEIENDAKIGSLSKIPDFLQGCSTSNEESFLEIDPREKGNEGAFIIETYNDSNREMIPLNLGENNVIQISKFSIDEFCKIANVTNPLSVQRERIFKLVNGEEVPLTVLLVFPESGDAKEFNCSRASVHVKKLEPPNNRGSVKKYGRGLMKGRVEKDLKEINEFVTDRKNLRRSKRKEVVAVDKNVHSQFQINETSYVEDLGIASFGSEAGIVVNMNMVNSEAELNEDMDTYSKEDLLLLQVQPTPGDLNADLSSEGVWKYLTQCASEESRVQGQVTQFNNESWLEVKRMSDFYQVDGEVMMDLSFKVVYKNDPSPVMYFLRGFSRLLKTGELKTAADVNNLFHCISRDRKLCLGLKPSPYQPSIDNNNQIRHYFKEKGQFVVTPFECLLSKACRGVVRISSGAPSSTFIRGDKTIVGVHALCRECALLGKKMNHLIKISAKNGLREDHDTYEKMMGDSFMQMLKEPIKSNGMSFNDLRHFFMQSVHDIISSTDSTVIYNNAGDTDLDEDFPSGEQRKRVRWSQKEEGESKSNIGVTEEAFMQMIDLKPPTSYGLGRSLVKKCNVCQFRAPTMLSLITHMKGHLGSLREKCGQCQIHLSSKSALETHKRQVHCERSPMCTICQLDFTTVDQLFDHMNKHRNHHPYECPYCSHKLTNKEAYKKHVRITHKVTSVKDLEFNCKTCNIYFYTPDHLILHRVNQNHEGIEPFICKVCSASCVTANEFRHHILQHSEEEQEYANLAICPECYKVFFSKYRLTYHLETKHSKTKTKAEVQSSPDLMAAAPAKKKKNRGPYLRYLRANERYECSRCKRRFKTRETLENHAKFAHGEKKPGKTDFICSLCGRKFNALRRLGNHMKIHSGNRPVFQCEECGQIYGKKTQVLEHIRMDHAEQVERHQQQQELLHAEQSQEQQLEDVQVQPQNSCVEGAASTSWSPIKSPFKVPSVEQTQEAVYSLLQLTDF